MRIVMCGVCLWLFAAVCSAAGPFDGLRQPDLRI